MSVMEIEDAHVRRDAAARVMPVISPYFLRQGYLPNATLPRSDEGEMHSQRDVGSSSRGAAKREVTGGLKAAADFFVHSLPGIPDMANHPTHPLNVYAGNIPSYPGEGVAGASGATGKDAELFFMMVKARRSAGRQRVILWFNGGPGCSSFDGALMEVGPFRVVPASQTASGQVEMKLVEGGWEEFATIVFIDQPPGTGFSYVPTNGYLHELNQAGSHLVQFLQNFYHIFPELLGQDTYLAGESFAGQYIPYFGDALIKTTLLPGFKLSGLCIGNGWIDPIQQYPGYADFAYEKGLVTKGTPEAEYLDQQLQNCMEVLKNYPDANGYTPVNVGGCGNVMDAASRPYIQELNGKKTCMNVYDVRLVDDWPACGMNWPPDLYDVYSFLRRSDVINALHATAKDTAWVECDGRVGGELHLWTSTAAVDFIPGILEAGVPVMLFAGAEDLICNYAGIERIVKNLKWGGQQGMGENSTALPWSLNGTEVGTWQTARGLTYVKVYASSHMVGFDVPHVTNDMITRFMNVDFSLLPGWAAGSKSSIGDVNRVQVAVASAAGLGVPLFKGGNGDWEAGYNAISAFLILFVLLGIVGVYFYFKRRSRLLKRRGMGLPLDPADPDGEERVPLGRLDPEAADEYELSQAQKRHGRTASTGSRKGKEKARQRATENGNGEVVFALGDDDEERK